MTPDCVSLLDNQMINKKISDKQTKMADWLATETSLSKYLLTEDGSTANTSQFSSDHSGLSNSFFRCHYYDHVC